MSEIKAHETSLNADLKLDDKQSDFLSVNQLKEKPMSNQSARSSLSSRQRKISITNMLNQKKVAAESRLKSR